MKKIYLAGFDVFYKNAREHGKELVRICNENGFEGLFPLDNEIDFNNKSNYEIAMEIANENKKLIQKCDIILANLSPFRGVEPDSGTVWECGYGEGLGKKIYAYSTDLRDLKEKVIEFQGLEKNAEYCKDDMFIEDFGLSNNLMFADKIVSNSFIECLEFIKNDLKNKKSLSV